MQRTTEISRLQDGASAPEGMAEEDTQDWGPLQVTSWCSQPRVADIRGRVGWLAALPHSCRTVSSHENRRPPLGMLKT